MTSPLFLSFFLPAVLVGVLLLQKTRFQSAWLLLSSCAFFAFSDIRFLPLMLALTVFTWLLSRFSARFSYVAAVLNLVVLLFFKCYGGPWPLGLSFVCLQGISYALDVKNGRAQKQGLVQTALYLTYFPKISAGPICRYADFSCQGNVQLSKGLERLIIGLGKKMLLASRLYPLAMAGFDAGAHPLACLSSIVCCALYVYYDFSAYTDMALGVSQMLDIALPENFNSPFSALSMRDFWRRWHITLSSFLRDYVYIKLGGSRRGRARTCLNVSVVFLLMGLWHGVTAPYLLFALWHAFFLCLEHANFVRPQRWPKIFRRLYTLLVSALGFVLFLAPEAGGIVHVFGGLFQTSPAPQALGVFLLRLSPLTVAALVACVILQVESVKRALKKMNGPLLTLLLLALLALSYIAMLAGGYLPFLYAQF